MDLSHQPGVDRVEHGADWVAVGGIGLERDVQAGTLHFIDLTLGVFDWQGFIPGAVKDEEFEAS